MTQDTITIHTIIHSTLDQVWHHWTTPSSVQGWNHASDDWHTPQATNDLQVGGRFSYTMAAKDGSMSFDFWGTYKEITPQAEILSEIGDGRSMQVLFSQTQDGVQVTETFQPENQNPIEMQRMGWQAILDNFKKYVETNA